MVATPEVKVIAVAVPKATAVPEAVGDRRRGAAGARRGAREGQVLGSGVAGRGVAIGVQGRRGQVDGGAGQEGRRRCAERKFDGGARGRSDDHRGAGQGAVTDFDAGRSALVEAHLAVQRARGGRHSGFEFDRDRGGEGDRFPRGVGDRRDVSRGAGRGAGEGETLGAGVARDDVPVGVLSGDRSGGRRRPPPE